MTLANQDSLIQAILSKDINKVTTLLEGGADPNTITSFGCPAIHAAILTGFTACVKTLLEHPNTDVTIKDAHGYTPSQLALQLGMTDILPLFMVSRDGVSTIDIGSSEMLHFMQWTGDVRILKLLKRLNQPISESDPTGLTPLVGAALTDNVDVVRFIISEFKPDINQAYSEGKTIFHLVASKPNCERVMSVLLATEGANPNILDDDGMAPIHIAVEEGAIPIINILLGSGVVDKNILNGEGLSPYLLAIQKGDPKVLSCFSYAEGVNKKIHGPGNKKAIMFAPSRGMKESFLTILFMDPDIEVDSSFLERDGDPIPESIKQLIINHRNYNK